MTKLGPERKSLDNREIQIIKVRLYQISFTKKCTSVGVSIIVPDCHKQPAML